MNFCHQTTPVAKTRHYCYLCDREIPKGTKYVRRVGTTDGDFWSSPMHLACAELADEEYGYDDWEFHDVGCFRDLLEERGIKP